MMKACLLPLVYSLSFVLFVSSAFGSDELIVNGGFSSLEGWEPLESATNREVADRNSPFQEVLPDNGKSVRLFNLAKTRVPYLQQTFPPVTSGKLKVSLDFCLSPETETADAPGWGVRFFDGFDPKTVTAGATISTRFRLTGEQGAGGAILMHQKFPPDQWYHFQAILDLDTKTWSGFLRDQNGAEESFQGQAFQPAGAGSASVGGLSIASMGAGKDQAPVPVFIDNISVRRLSE